VVVLGDSFVWAHGVEEADAFPALLESALAVPVLGAGRGGWSTKNELAWLQETAARPRVVVLSYDFNDMEDALPSVNEAYHATGADESFVGHRTIPLVGQSFLLDLAIFRMRARGLGARIDDWT